MTQFPPEIIDLSDSDDEDATGGNPFLDFSNRNGKSLQNGASLQNHNVNQKTNLHPNRLSGLLNSSNVPYTNGFHANPTLTKSEANMKAEPQREVIQVIDLTEEEDGMNLDLIPARSDMKFQGAQMPEQIDEKRKYEQHYSTPQYITTNDVSTAGSTESLVSKSDIKLDDNHTNTLPSNNGSSGAKEVTKYDDDDDDIIVIEPEEAAKKSFKPTSFEINLNRYQESLQSDFLRRVQPQESQIIVQRQDPVFNGPAPVPHWGPDHQASEVAEQNQLQLQSRLDLCKTEKSRVQDEFKRINTERSKALQTKSAIENRLRVRNFEKQRLSEATSSANDSARLLELDDNIRRDVKEGFELDRFISTCQNTLQSLGNRLSLIISNIKAFENRVTGSFMNGQTPGILEVINNGLNYGRIDVDERNGHVLQRNLMGFANNVYSTSSADANDLQNLLNNIQTEEEEIAEEGLEKTPEEMTITLLKHQRMGLSWLLRMEKSRSKGGILADDMGLGKTVQAIALLLSNKSKNEKVKTTLVIAPVSLLRQWAAEISSKIKPEFALSIAIFHGAAKKSLSRAKDLLKYDVVLTSYGTLSSEWKKHYKEALRSAGVTKFQNVVPDYGSGGQSYVSPFYDHTYEDSFYRIILDEAQAIKNKISIASKAVHNLRSTYRFCMSGTPMQNNVEELYSLIRFLRIRPYNDDTKFRNTFVLPLKSLDDFTDVEENPAMKKLRIFLKAVMLRRNKKTKIDGKPILNLPEKHVMEVKTQMHSDERAYYTNLENKTKDKAAKMLQQNHLEYSSILVLLLRLRQACCHSFLVEIGEMRKTENEAEDEVRSQTLSHKRDWNKMYQSTIEFSPQTVERIQQDVGDIDSNESSAFSCPLCFYSYGYEHVILFPGCGHMICENCVDSFFDNNEEGDNPEGKRTAKCSICPDAKTTVREDNLIDYNMFHRIHSDKKNKTEVLNEFESIMITNVASNRGKTTNAQKIATLLQKSNGVFTPSAKIKECISLIKNIINNKPGEKIIVFSQFVVLFDLMRLALQHEKINFLRYDGSMSMDDKNATIKRFYQEEDTRVLLLSLRAGNVGLTLTCASHVIIMDPFWNPFVEEQAQDRAHRIGQQREVFVHRLLIPDSVENRIMELQLKKKEMVGSALNDDGLKKVSRLGRQELGFLFGLNAL